LYTIFTANIIDLEEGTSNKPKIMIRKRDDTNMEESSEKSIRDLDTKLEELNCIIFRRRFHDSLVMARIRENLDTISNTNKEDKMVILGMSSKVPRPTEIDKIRKWLKEIELYVLNSIEQVTFDK
jgi:hypothetical protein